jgi:hypothetical protein
MQNNSHAKRRFISSFCLLTSSFKSGADGETRTLVGQCARQFTKLLLSLLSHIGVLNAEGRMKNAE